LNKPIDYDAPDTLVVVDGDGALDSTVMVGVDDRVGAPLNNPQP
jgi:hypothetical protein